MRLLPLLPLILLTAAAPASTLSQLDGFKPGQWERRELGGKTTSQCLADPQPLLFGDHSGAGCRVTEVLDAGAKGAISYACPDGRSGRTDVRRDNETTYTVNAQGIASGLPFAAQADWRRTGDCTAK